MLLVTFHTIKRIETVQPVFALLGTCSVPKPRRQRHSLWTRSHAALALTLRALSGRAERRVFGLGLPIFVCAAIISKKGNLCHEP